MRHKKGYANTRDKIIDAALSIISSEGFYNVTIRKVSSMAGVNVAAVNYHFGSKELMINEALRSITDQLKSAFDVLRNKNIDPIQRLHRFASDYSSTITKYPEIITFFIMQSIKEYEISGQYEAFLKEEGYELIKKTTMSIRPHENELIIEMRIMQLLGSMAFPVLLASKSRDYTSFDYFQVDMREQYVSLLIDVLTQGR